MGDFSIGILIDITDEGNTPIFQKPLTLRLAGVYFYNLISVFPVDVDSGLVFDWDYQSSG